MALEEGATPASTRELTVCGELSMATRPPQRDQPRCRGRRGHRLLGEAGGRPYLALGLALGQRLLLLRPQRLRGDQSANPCRRQVFRGEGSKHFECCARAEFSLWTSVPGTSIFKRTHNRKKWPGYKCVLSCLCLEATLLMWQVSRLLSLGLWRSRRAARLWGRETDCQLETLGKGLAPVRFSSVSGQEPSVSSEGCELLGPF